MDFAALVGAWPALVSQRMTPLTRGANNAVYLVDADSGRYVLRVYHNHADAARLDAEFQILLALQHAGLPFAIPSPVATADGQYYTRFADADQRGQMAALFPWLPGDHPDRRDTAAAFGAAVALGQLDQALASLSFPRDQMPAPLGDFVRRYPALTEPIATLATLTSDAAALERIADLDQRLNAELPTLYAALPCQIVHIDYAPSNILMEDARVTAVLDFEFSTYDLRALDLVVALSWWPIELLGSGQEWPLINALGTGYASQIQLTDAEIAALPTLLQMRSIGSLLHRIERYTQGLDSADFLRQRIAQTLWREDWLTANRETLLRLATRWREM
ncbi:MAG TPA: phosphotransferase [Ktedonobacterales bacterium]|jgi:homoserine kinase type II